MTLWGALSRPASSYLGAFALAVPAARIAPLPDTSMTPPLTSLPSGTILVRPGLPTRSKGTASGTQASVTRQHPSPPSWLHSLHRTEHLPVLCIVRFCCMLSLSPYENMSSTRTAFCQIAPTRIPSAWQRVEPQEMLSNEDKEVANLP